MLSILRSALTGSGPSELGPDWRRAAPDPAQRRNDLLVGLAVTLVTVGMVELSRSAGMLDYGPQRSVAEQLGWGAAIALPLVARRTYPLIVLTICSLVFLVSGLRAPMVGATFMVQLCFFSSLYTAAAWGRDRRRTTALFGVVSLVMFAWVAVIIAQGGMVDDLADTEQIGLVRPLTAAALVTVVVNVIYFLGAWMVGTAAWRSARQREELRLKTERLAQEQALSAQRAVVADRVRIARELHDVVAHHVSVIGVQAGAARRTLDRDPDVARTALSAVEESSRQAVREMRSLLRVLRFGDDPGDPPAEGPGQGPGRGQGPEPDVDRSRSPQPGVERLPDLAGELVDQGLQVRFQVVGEPFAVPETVSLSLYRTAQEALSNVRRHSTARSAQVTLRYLHSAPAVGSAAGSPRGRAVEVEVLDGGRPNGAGGGSGLGHLGMRERAAMHGGVVELGPRPFGGYRVRMRFPVTADDVAVREPGHGAGSRPATVPTS